jgi:hypothetical protein
LQFSGLSNQMSYYRHVGFFMFPVDDVGFNVQHLRFFPAYCHVYGVTIDSVWIDDSIYWTL